MYVRYVTLRYVRVENTHKHACASYKCSVACRAPVVNQAQQPEDSSLLPKRDVFYGQHHLANRTDRQSNCRAKSLLRYVAPCQYMAIKPSNGVLMEACA